MKIFTLLKYQTGEQTESLLEGKSQVYKEWSSRRPWKERKKASKVRENVAPKLFSQTQDPELIYYGRESGVIGLSKNEVCQDVTSYEVFEHGYDKVRVPIFPFCLLFLGFTYRVYSGFLFSLVGYY